MVPCELKSLSPLVVFVADLGVHISKLPAEMTPGSEADILAAAKIYQLLGDELLAANEKDQKVGLVTIENLEKTNTTGSHLMEVWLAIKIAVANYGWKLAEVGLAHLKHNVVKVGLRDAEGSKEATKSLLLWNNMPAQLDSYVKVARAVFNMKLGDMPDVPDMASLKVDTKGAHAICNCMRSYTSLLPLDLAKLEELAGQGLAKRVSQFLGDFTQCFKIFTEKLFGGADGELSAAIGQAA